MADDHPSPASPAADASAPAVPAATGHPPANLADTPAAPPPARATTPARDIRPLVYAGLDLLMAAVYAVALFELAPNRHPWAGALAAGLVAAAVVMGASMLVRRPWSRWVCASACAALLALTVAFLVLLVAGAAFLAGVYGAFGRAASVIVLVMAAVVIELVGLLPAFQLKYLRTRAGRRWFGREPA